MYGTVLYRVRQDRFHFMHDALYHMHEMEGMSYAEYSFRFHAMKGDTMPLHRFLNEGGTKEQYFALLTL